MDFHQKVKGFTLIELMVTLAIMAIMAAIAMPNLSTFAAKTRINNRAEQIANLIRYARSEAIRMNVPVVICGDTIRSDGRPNGQCTSNIYTTAANGGLKAFADTNRNGSFSSVDGDTDLRTITINSNRRNVDIELNYCPVSGNCSNAADPKQMVFFPDGKFGVQTQSGNLNGINFSSRYAQFILKDAEKSTDTSFYRYVVVSPSGNVEVCTHNASDTRHLCES